MGYTTARRVAGCRAARLRGLECRRVAILRPCSLVALQPETRKPAILQLCCHAALQFASLAACKSQLRLVLRSPATSAVLFCSVLLCSVLSALLRSAPLCSVLSCLFCSVRSALSRKRVRRSQGCRAARLQHCSAARLQACKAAEDSKAAWLQIAERESAELLAAAGPQIAELQACSRGLAGLQGCKAQSLQAAGLQDHKHGLHDCKAGCRLQSWQGCAVWRVGVAILRPCSLVALQPETPAILQLCCHAALQFASLAACKSQLRLVLRSPATLQLETWKPAICSPALASCNLAACTAFLAQRSLALRPAILQPSQSPVATLQPVYLHPRWQFPATLDNLQFCELILKFGAASGEKRILCRKKISRKHISNYSGYKAKNLKYFYKYILLTGNKLYILGEIRAKTTWN